MLSDSHGIEMGHCGSRTRSSCAKKVTADYVYVMHFTGDQIGHLTKIWNSTISLQQLGWA
jgi:hypothetical protein